MEVRSSALSSHARSRATPAISSLHWSSLITFLHMLILESLYRTSSCILTSLCCITSVMDCKPKCRLLSTSQHGKGQCFGIRQEAHAEMNAAQGKGSRVIIAHHGCHRLLCIVMYAAAELAANNTQWQKTRARKTCKTSSRCMFHARRKMQSIQEE